MFKLFWHKPLKISKRDVYTVDVYSWSKEENILTLTAVASTNLVSIENNLIATNRLGKNSIVGVTVSGLAEGIETITLHYTTATRSDSVEVELTVGEACLIH